LNKRILIYFINLTNYL